VGVTVCVGVGVGGHEYGSNVSQPFASTILTITEEATSNGDGTSNINVGGIIVDPVTR
jgi:hypothetical protein